MTHLGDVQFENVYPAVAECFFIILAGYLAGRLNLISSTETKGLNVFVSHFSLPALIFLSLASLRLQSVNWKFLLSILIAKSVVFFAVAIITMVIQRPVNLGKAALYSIFCTQSNDFALGYPIVQALYKQVHPEYSDYLYLAAPISLAFLNPIGLVLLEIQSGQQQQAHQQQQTHVLKLIGRTVVGIFTHPVVIMTICGIIGNFAFKQNVPLILNGVLNVLGEAFSATALFSLGLKMVGKVGNLKRHDVTICTILIGIKILVLPLIIRETVLLVNAGAHPNDTAELSTYGFLYGTFPTAPGIFVFANQYNIAADLIATAVSGCTLLAAPFIFVSAKMISLHFSLPSDYMSEFQTLLFNVGIVSLVGCVFTFIVFVVFKKWRKMPHWITFSLLVSQFLICIGAILWHSLDNDVRWVHHLQFILFTTGIYASRIWSALLALGLVLLRWRSLCFLLRLKKVFFITGWSLSLGMVLILFFMLFREEGPITKIDPYFVYGTSHAVASSLVLFCCLCITVVCLITQQRFENCCEYQSLLRSSMNNGDPIPNADRARPVAEDGNRSASGESSLLLHSKPSAHCHGGDECHIKKIQSEMCGLQDVEDLIGFDISGASHSFANPPNDMCDSQASCSFQQRKECSTLIKSYHAIQNDEQESDTEEQYDDMEFVQHTILLYMLCLSMFVGLGVSVWRIMLTEITGIYVELEFLDGILNVGQGFFIFIVFGTNLAAIKKIANTWKIFYQRHRYANTPADDLNINSSGESILRK